MIRLYAVVACSFLALAAAACGGDNNSVTVYTPIVARPSATAPAPRTPVVATQAAATPEPGEAVTVTGIVGSVNRTSNTIEINRISGAQVGRIEIGPNTTIRRADGSTATLSNIRPSDRIVASGIVDNGSGALAASQVEVQQVVPGGAPGG